MSGEKVELPKCLAYIVVYDWNKGKPQQQSKSAMTTVIQVCNAETQQQTVIDIKDPKDSHKTLGTHQNPAGISIQQCNILSQKEKKMIVFFCHSKLPTYKVHLAYHLMCTKSLQFPLGVTLMTYNMANNVSKQATRAVIRAMHVNRSLPRMLAFHPSQTTGTWSPTPLLHTRYKPLQTDNTAHPTKR
jgi:O6-methylguanine-DNA--protein-cysteine methyltransferase